MTAHHTPDGRSTPASSTPASSTPPGAPDPHADLNRRIFRKLMPLLIGAYVLSFLDRTNIGLAKEQLEADLGISAAAYGLGAGLFFLTYAVFEVPSNLILHRVGARFWITRIMITWGLLSAAMAFVQGTTSFYVLRLLLGFAEAGLFPGIMLYLTYWFGKDLRARANGLFLLGVSVANILGAPLGGALLEMDGLAGWHGWQWMFVIEGLPAVLLAFVVWRKLPDRPTQAAWLDPAEARDLEARLAAEQQAGAAGSGTHSLRGVLRDKQILLVVAIYFCHQIAIYSVSYYLPSIIGSYGDLSNLTIGLLTAVPWAASAVGTVILPRLARGSARSRRLVIGGLCAMAAGLAVAAASGPVLGLLGFAFGAFAFFAVQSVLFAFPASRLTGAALAGGLALVNTLGLTGGFLGPYVMGFLEDSTGTATSGLWFVVALAAVGALLAVRLRRGEEESAPSGPGAGSAVPETAASR